MLQEDLIAMRTKGAGLENDNQYWTKEDRDTLVSGFRYGAGVSELALRLGRSERAIMQQLILEGCYDNIVKKRSRRKGVEKCLCKKCAKRMNCPKGNCKNSERED